MTQDKWENLDSSVEALQKEIKQAMTEAALRPVNPWEFYYLLSRYPYLEVSNIGAEAPPANVVPKLHTLENSWVIHDYGYLLRCGKPALLGEKYWSSPIQGESEEDEGGQGSITVQYVEVAGAMVRLAMDLGWEGLEIIAGLYPMRRAAWIASVQNKFPVKGFASTIQDRIKMDKLHSLKSGNLQKEMNLKKPS